MNCFYFNGKIYGIGTIIEIREEYNMNFKFHSILKFERYNMETNTYQFVAIGNGWDVFYIPTKDLTKYIQSITSASYDFYDDNKKTDPRCIEGITSAWIWYIIIMIFGLFIKGVGSKIIILVVASIIFFSWRNKKINGG